MGEILQINKDLKVYHLSYGWGVVTSCEPGEPFQVKFPHRDEVYSFYRDGSEILNGKQVVFNNDVVVTEKPNSDKDIYSFTTFVTQDGDVAFRFDGVNNSEILSAIVELFGVVCAKELFKGNNIDVLEGLIGQLGDDLKQKLHEKHQELIKKNGIRK